MKPGEYILADDAVAIAANAERDSVILLVTHTGDRPVQVGSHFHFFEVNRALVFKREAAYGMRLNIPAGTAVRFEPGDVKEVTLVTLAGDRIMFGHNALVNGRLDDPAIKSAALSAITEKAFGDE